MFTPVSGHFGSSGSNLMRVARPARLNAGASATLMMSGSSIREP
jgi:hypothetical protein